MYDAISPLEFETVSPAPSTRQAAAAAIFSGLTISEARYIAGGGDHQARLAHIKMAWLQAGSPLLTSMAVSADTAAAAIMSDVTALVNGSPP